MTRQSNRRGFTLRELIVVTFILVIAFAVGIPALRNARERERQRECFQKLQQLGIALASYESVNRRYPPASFGFQPNVDPARDCRPADSSGSKSTAGFSWIVAVYPHMPGPPKGFQAIQASSQNFAVKTGAFTPSLTYGVATNQHVSCVYLSELVCPAWAGDGFTNGGTTIDIGSSGGAPLACGAPEYAGVDSNTPGSGSQSFKGKVAPTNYKPIVGTHVRSGIPVLNGGMALGPTGFTVGAIADGTSKTIALCETKESGYASWYDGTLNWLVATDPNSPAPGMSSAPDTPPWRDDAALALNRGFNPAVPGSIPYLKKSLTANSPLNDVWWGPSSDHAEGIISHVFLDGHVIGITDQCDPPTYLGLITRNGSEVECGCEPIR